MEEYKHKKMSKDAVSYAQTSPPPPRKSPPPPRKIFEYPEEEEKAKEPMFSTPDIDLKRATSQELYEYVRKLKAEMDSHFSGHVI